jgi:hypothetical protein
MSNQRRAQILEMLRAHPNGMATLPLAQQLGATINSRKRHLGTTDAVD